MENIVTQDATFNLSTTKTAFEHRIDCRSMNEGTGRPASWIPAKPIPIGFALAIITRNSYFSDSVVQPSIIGNVANDIPPWNTWVTEDISLN
jgi:hypothetical protein